MAVYPQGHPFPTTHDPVVLAARLTSATLLAGAVGGAGTALLFLAMGEAVGVAINVVPALVLHALLAWRLVAPRTGPSGRLLAAAAAAVVTAVLATGALVEIVRHGGGFDARSIGFGGYAAGFGALAGLVPSVSCLLVLVVSLSVARRAGLRVTGVVVERVTALLAMTMTAGFALLVVGAFAGDLRIGDLGVSAMAAALAGTGADLAVRWSLVDRAG